MLHKTDLKFDINPIIDQVNSLEFDKRLALNYTEGSLLNGPYITKPEFVGTPLGNVLDSIKNPGEARLLKLTCAETYTAHTDPDDRYHLPITTNKHSYIINFETKEMHHLPVDGTLWYMNTGIIHAASNFGTTDRIHLNIRKLLPSYKKGGYMFYLKGTEFNWKSKYYDFLMPEFNKGIKYGTITGIKKVSDREVLINCSEEYSIFIMNKLKEEDLSVDVFLH